MTTWTYARPPILERLSGSSEQHVLVEASAGTGKTFTLEHIVAQEVLQGTPLDAILVVTFTEKATREMRFRVRRLLEEMLRGPVPGGTDRVNPANGPAWTIDAVAQKRLRDALEAFDRAAISTIHGFCQRALFENAFLSGERLNARLEPAAGVLRSLLLEVIRKVLHPDHADRSMVQAALAMVSLDDLTQTIGKLMFQRGRITPVQTQQTLAAALSSLPGSAQRDIIEGALRHRKKTIKVVDALLERLTALESLAGHHDLGAAALEVVAWQEATANPGQAKATTQEYLRNHLVSVLKDEPTTRSWVDAVEHVLDFSPVVAAIQMLLPRVQQALARSKERDGSLDFDDLLLKLRAALHGPGSAGLMSSLRARYRVVLVDEFQDTDEVQWDIFKTAFFPQESKARLILIGDPKQAIYGFRNADVRVYQEAARELGVPPVRLVHNFRSSPDLLNVFDGVFKDIFAPQGVTWTAPEPGKPGRRALVNGVPSPPLHLMGVVSSEEYNPGAAKHALHACVARQISQILFEKAHAVTVHDGPETRKVGAGDIFVLVHTNNDAELVGHHLRAWGVPFSFFRQEGLFATREAQDIERVLTALLDPEDRGARGSALLTPFFMVQLQDLKGYLEPEPGDAAVERLRRWGSMAQRRQFDRLFHDLVDGSGLARRLLACQEDERALTNHLHLLELLLEEAHRGQRDLRSLLGWLRGMRTSTSHTGSEVDVQRLESEHRSVQVLTLHKAKGLEADVVFLAGGLTRQFSNGLADRVYHDATGARCIGLKPRTSRQEALADEEEKFEDLRHMYVAFTRARARLYVPYFGEGPHFRAGEHAAPKTAPNGPYAAIARALNTFVDNNQKHCVFLRAPLHAAMPEGSAPVVVAAAALKTSPPPVVAPELASLRASRRGPQEVSYSSLKRASGGYHGQDDAPSRTLTAESHDVVPDVLSNDLPGGKAMGEFLHAVLEHVSYDAVRDHNVTAWSALPEVAALFERKARVHGVRLSAVAPAQKVLHRALTVPMELGPLQLPGGLCTLEHRVAEASVVYPIPENTHAQLGQEKQTGRFVVDRGYVRGVVDLVFEHGGKSWFLDWKGDRLVDWSDDAVKAHVELNYATQAALYTLGVLRMMGIHTAAAYESSFGGLAYCFLRGMTGGAHGIHFVRPGWAQVVEWETGMRQGKAPWDFSAVKERLEVLEASA